MTNISMFSLSTSITTQFPELYHFLLSHLFLLGLLQLKMFFQDTDKLLASNYLSCMMAYSLMGLTRRRTQSPSS
jgi:hypothetical protein